MTAQVWVMALGDKPDPDCPMYAEDTHPRQARACVEVDDFADLFPIFNAWCEHFDTEITAYAMPVAVTAEGRPAAGWEEEWVEVGPPIRLDAMPGGFIQIRPDGDFPVRGRPPFDLTLTHPAAAEIPLETQC
ncbi:hypothetical protein QZH56_30350 [Streptomyces olivoreticuli]|uniref:hypothetical protein n=1 Tax=Streptomyces olivoreticuli TaxID=68246 RepID=UPI002658B6D7|nr:hypothetical protein [Streptomyces olivoreticuli]WKK23006.1 hypothetical protein QZH56_30350 [Streptomyces olivoreticuli]